MESEITSRWPYPDPSGPDPDRDNATVFDTTSAERIALKLEELDKDGALMKPLLGEIEARMSIYRKLWQGDPETSIMSSVGFCVDDLRVFLANEAKVFPAADLTAIVLQWAEILIGERRRRIGRFGKNFQP